MALDYSWTGAGSALLLIVAAIFGSTILRGSQHDTNEPLSLPSKFPVIGHLIGIIHHQADYLKTLW